ncbi:serine/threonine-protein phosphatase 6 regulatory ankyrin repeat subunit B-like [Haliotis asinina]|uniref:serine/threonine-protein phosphatase 6 regulatory ankyrin repeat subunit B-like n=1 Tax=Haliotis asinina TaxID=109174 RepID=UPI003531ED50
MAHRTSESPRRVGYSRTQSTSPPRVPEQRAQSKSPPRLSGHRAQSQSPPRIGFHRTQSRSPPKLKEQRAESKSPPRLAEDRAQSASPPRTTGHHRPRGPRVPQSADSQRMQKSGRTGGNHRRATPTPSQRTAPTEFDLHAACYMGNMAAVRRLLSQDQSDINRVGGLWDMTPVVTAALQGHRDMVELLVSRGADVSLVDVYCDNILHYACVGGDRTTVEFVLSLDAVDVNSRGGVGRTPVMAAALGGHRDVVELLVSRGADVSLVDHDGDNILHVACEGGDRTTVEFVLSLDAVDVNSRDGGGWTPVMAAARGGHRDVVELLVSRGADVSLVDVYGDNILHVACEGGDRTTVEFVLSLDAVDVNDRNNKGQTAADVARRWGHRQLSDLLVSRGTQ